ncbi:MAG: hypothetical protein WCO84_06915 [bacterium]
MSAEFVTDSTPLELVNLGSLAEECVLYLPGCADLMIRKELQRTFRDFCKNTSALRVTVRKTLLKDVVTYNLPLPYACVIDSIYKLMIGDQKLEKNTDYTIQDGDTVTVTLAEGSTASIDDSATTKTYLDVYCILRPQVASEDCPLFFLNRYADAIVSGTLARLHLMSRKPWSDSGMAQIEAGEYTNWKSSATVDAIAGHSEGALSGSKTIDCFNREGLL